MLYLFLKFSLSAALILAISEIAKKWPLMGALVASLPLTSILAMCWLYRETGNLAQVSQLSSDILWLVVPSLLLFVLLPVLIRRGLGFASALALSSFATSLAYLLFYQLKTKA